jgi:transposase
MGRAIAVRTDYRSGDVRRIAQRVKNAAQARRLLAIAAVLDGAARQEAAKIGGMDRQTLRDWVIRFNEQGPDGLINKVSPGAPGKLTNEHKAFLARLVEDGPIPALDGVVRWRACDLIMRLHQEFGISVSDDTVYRSLKGLGFSHVSARPRAYKQNAEAMEAFKKTSPPRGGCPRETRAWHTDRGVVPGRDAGRPEEQTHLPLGQERLTSSRHPRSTYPVDLSVRCGLPGTRGRSCPRAASLQQRGHAASS